MPVVSPVRKAISIDLPKICWPRVKREIVFAAGEFPDHRRMTGCFRLNPTRIRCWLCVERRSTCDSFPENAEEDVAGLCTNMSTVYGLRSTGVPEEHEDMVAAKVTCTTAWDKFRQKYGTAAHPIIRNKRPRESRREPTFDPSSDEDYTRDQESGEDRVVLRRRTRNKAFKDVAVTIEAEPIVNHDPMERIADNESSESASHADTSAVITPSSDFQSGTEVVQTVQSTSLGNTENPVVQVEVLSAVQEVPLTAVALLEKILDAQTMSNDLLRQILSNSNRNATTMTTSLPPDQVPSDVRIVRRRRVEIEEDFQTTNS